MSREGALDRLVGQVLAARYRIGARLGAGAMGTVFRAEHVKLGRKLAVKVLHPQMLANEKYRRRFDREAELAGKLHHRNVAGVIDVGITPQGLRYLVMEYAEGPTLTELIKAAPLPGPRVVSLAKQLCDGLHHAHEHGLVHRDFKPENVIVERDGDGGETPRILDFGIAIALDDFSAAERERLTTEGMVLGTPHYMAPEHATGQPIDHRSDLFALGVICYELLAGVMPFDGPGVEVARAYLSRPIPEMKLRAPRVEVDPVLEAFTRALLARSRDERPPSAKAARELLELVEDDRAAAAERLGVTLHPPRRTLPVAAAPPPARAGGARPPLPSAWTSLPTERMAADAVTAAVRAAVAAAPTVPASQAELAGTVLEPAGARPEPEPDAPACMPVALPRIAEPLPVTEEVARAAPARRRAPWIAAVLVGVGLCVIGGLGLRGRPAPASPAHAAAAPEPAAMPEAPATTPPAPEVSAPAPVPAAPAPEDPPVPAPAPPAPEGPALAPAPAPAPPAPAATAPRATATASPPPVLRPRTTAPPGSPAVAAPATPVSGEAAPEDPSTAAVAELYGEIGRSLKRLDDTHGQEATYDLWPRFRRIRIFEALRTRDARIDAHNALRYLAHEIEQRSR